MTADYRAELQLLFDAAESFTEPALGHHRAWEAAMDRTRTLLAQPEPEGPSADEWDALVARAWDQYETVGYQGERFMYDSDFNNALDLVRQELTRYGRPTPQSEPEVSDGKTREAVLAAVAGALGGDAYDCLRVWSAWGCGTMGPDDFSLVAEDDDRVAEIADAAIQAIHPTPQPPVDGEVVELVAALTADAECVEVEHYDLCNMTSNQMRRAAELLQHPQPVAVSERLPGAGDLAPWPDEPEAPHWCWFVSDTYGAWLWEQRSAGEHTYRHQFYTHWLPAHALPLPTSEDASNAG